MSVLNNHHRLATMADCMPYHQDRDTSILHPVNQLLELRLADFRVALPDSNTTVRSPRQPLPPRLEACITTTITDPRMRAYKDLVAYALPMQLRLSVDVLEVAQAAGQVGHRSPVVNVAALYQARRRVISKSTKPCNPFKPPWQHFTNA